LYALQLLPQGLRRQEQRLGHALALLDVPTLAAQHADTVAVAKLPPAALRAGVAS